MKQNIEEFFNKEKLEWTRVDEAIDSLGKSIEELKNMLDEVLKKN